MGEAMQVWGQGVYGNSPGNLKLLQKKSLKKYMYSKNNYFSSYQWHGFFILYS